MNVNSSRRKLVIASFAALASMLLERFNESSKYLTNQQNSTGWHIDPIKLAPGQSVDLSLTLPPNTPRGGHFFVDPSGKSLPIDINLSKQGILSISSEITEIDIEGVIFGYTV